MEEDADLKLLERRKLEAMRRRLKAAAPSKAEKTDREVVEGILYDRGDEVLETAYQSYPKQTQVIVDQLARLLIQNGMREKISGGELYSLFRSLGLRFSLRTTIKVQDKGKLVDLKDKLKMDAGEG